MFGTGRIDPFNKDKGKSICELALLHILCLSKSLRTLSDAPGQWRRVRQIRLHSIDPLRFKLPIKSEDKNLKTGRAELQFEHAEAWILNAADIHGRLDKSEDKDIVFNNGIAGDYFQQRRCSRKRQSSAL